MAQNFLRVIVDPVNADIDIVAVHGLNPTNTELHAAETWTSGEKLWLRDFLPKRLPRARVLLSGYNANVAFQPDAPSRAIVFVCHSLGGIVVKQALVEAKLNATYTSIRESTYGIAFFATPHRGGHNVMLGEVASKIARVALRNPDNTMLEALKRDSLYGEEMRNNYRHSLEDFQVLSFYETRPFHRVGIIVDQTSATLGLAGTREIQIPVDADHSHICKFASEDDDYEQVIDNLEEMVRDALRVREDTDRLSQLQAPIEQPGHASEEAILGFEGCLQSLAYLEMGIHEQCIEEAIDGTCSWILKHQSYMTWTQSEQDILWVLGKPGSGKSITMKFLHGQESGANLVAKFHFNGTGKCEEKSLIGLYRALLYQTLPFASPQHQQKLFSIYNKRLKCRCEPGQVWDRHDKVLKQILQDVVKDLHRHRLRIYIDALNEIVESAAMDLVLYLKEMLNDARGNEAALQICLSCQHYPLIGQGGITVSLETQNADDISIFVLSQFTNASVPTALVDQIIPEITSRAGGISQWVVVVTRETLRDLRARRTVPDVCKRIKNFPPDLHGLYERVISGITVPHERYECGSLLRWVCFGFRSFKLDELRYLLVLREDSKFSTVEDIKNHDKYLKDDEDLKTRVTDISRGLVEMRKGVNEQFYAVCIHDSVKDFLLHEGGLSQIDGNTTLDTQTLSAHSHLSLARCCFRYLIASLPDRTPEEVYNQCHEDSLLEYAILGWIQHVQEIEDGMLVDLKCQLLRQFNVSTNGTSLLQQWLSCYGHWLLRACRCGKLRPLELRSDFDVAVWFGQGSVAEQLRTTHNASALLTRAVMADYLPAVKVLLDHDMADINQASCECDRGMPLLNYVVLKRSPDDPMLHYLLDHNSVDNNARDDCCNDTPLHYALHNPSAGDMIRALLRRNDVLCNPDNKYGLTPLFKAVHEDHLEAVKAFLEHGNIDVNAKDKNGFTPLYAALNASRPYAVLKALLSHDATDVNVSDRWGRKPLQYALDMDKSRTAILLVMQHDKINDWSGRTTTGEYTPLHLALQAGLAFETVHRIIASDSVDVNARDDFGYAPLHLVTLLEKYKDNRSALEALLNHKDINANIKSNADITPLLCAIRWKSLAHVQSLLQCPNIDVNMSFKEGPTLLVMAHHYGCPDIAAALEAKGATTGAQSGCSVS